MMSRLISRIVNKFQKCYVMFHCTYYYLFNNNLKRKMRHILSLTESTVGIVTAEEVEQGLPGFAPYRQSGYYKYMLGRYLYSLKYLRNKTVLDCACGLGWGSFLISDHPQEILSIDLNREALDFANATWKGDKLNFIQHSALDLESLGRKFDVVLAFELIEHLQFSDGAKLLEQANHVLTEDGLIILSSWFPCGEKAEEGQGQKNRFHLHLYSKEEIKDLLAKNGFSKPRFLGSFMVIAAKGQIGGR